MATNEVAEPKKNADAKNAKMSLRGGNRIDYKALNDGIDLFGNEQGESIRVDDSSPEVERTRQEAQFREKDEALDGELDRMQADYELLVKEEEVLKRRQEVADWGRKLEAKKREVERLRGEADYLFVDANDHKDTRASDPSSSVKAGGLDNDITLGDLRKDKILRKQVQSQIKSWGLDCFDSSESDSDSEEELSNFKQKKSGHSHSKQSRSQSKLQKESCKNKSSGKKSESKQELVHSLSRKDMDSDNSPALVDMLRESRSKSKKKSESKIKNASVQNSSRTAKGSFQKSKKKSERSLSRDDTDSDSFSDSSDQENYSKYKSKKNSMKNQFYESTESDSSSDASKKKSKSKKKKKSGISAKASDSVVNRQRYPHAHLRFEFVSDTLQFENLDFDLFVAGELEIISSSVTGKAERIGRTDLLKRLCYLSASHEFGVIRSLYAAVLREIEIGHLNWGDSYDYVENAVLKGKDSFKKGSYKGKRPKYQKAKAEGEALEKVWFCSQYQRNKCYQKAPHTMVVKGVMKLAHHICATCWLKDKLKLDHPECSTSCPHAQD